MSLEDAVNKLTAAVEANTAALKSGGGGKSASSSSSASTAATGKYTKDQMSAALNDVKEKQGTPAAKKIIKEVGGVDKIAEITDAAKIDAVYEAAKKALEAAEEM